MDSTLKYYSKSQAKQDLWVCEQTNLKKNGFFVDIGAHDGVYLSNTFMLEKQMKWSGICIEAEKVRFERLCESRTSTNVCCAVRDYNGFCSFTNAEDNNLVDDGFVNAKEKEGDIPCKTINDILEENNAPRYIDYISLDIEGLEVEVLSSFDFSKWDVKLWTIEHNLYLDGPENKQKIQEIMSSNGYKCSKENVLAETIKGLVPFEDWFIKL